MSSADRADRQDFKKKMNVAMEAGDAEAIRTLALDERHVPLMVKRAQEKVSEAGDTHANLVLLYVLQEQERIIRAMHTARRHQLEKRLDDMTARVNALEQSGPGINYRGVWSASERYERGDWITWDGGMWYLQVGCNHGITFV